MTLVVVPILKVSTFPTGRHTCSVFLNSGENKKPIIGIPTRAAPISPMPMLIICKKLRRLISFFEVGSPLCGSVTFINHRSNPTCQGKAGNDNPRQRD